MENGDYECAIENFSLLAEMDDISSMVNLVYIYANNDDYNNALKWMERAAELGEPKMQTLLSYFYLSPEGEIEPDTTKAIKWMKIRAEASNDTTAQYNLAMVYLMHNDKYYDVDEAILWLKKAAIMGMTSAATKLGMMYCDGVKGLENDYTEAHKWLELAAKKDDNVAQYYLGYMYGTGKGVKVSNKKSLKWHKKAAANGNTGSKAIVEILKTF